MLGACTTTQVEYDRMTGTAYPQPETVAGEEVNLTTIYLQSGIFLGVDEDTTTIAPLTGPFDASDPDQYDYITDAERETIVLNNRTAPVGPDEWECQFWFIETTCTQYHVYGIVVDHFRERDDGTRSTTLMGLMYDSADRSGFVNYYKHSINRSDNAKYLRSTAHEIGHAFNLNHCDGDGSTTIMNQTGTVGNSFSYDFSDPSLVHLQDHPKDVVWPGIGPREYECPHGH
jgi:hypothetical protein